MSFTSPHKVVPVHLLGSSAYSPALAIYISNDTADVTIDATDINVTVGVDMLSFPYIGKSLDELSQDISIASQAVHCNPLAKAYQITSNELIITSGEMTSDGAFVVRMNSHMINYTEETRIRALPPYPEPRAMPWYPRVDRGYVTFDKDGVKYLFSVPEYDAQQWSFHYGKPFVTERGVRPFSIKGKQLRVTRSPVYWRDHNIKISVNGIVAPRSMIEDVDENNGILFLSTALNPEDAIVLDYVYEEKSLVYRRMNLNPSVDHNPGIMGSTVALYLLPTASSLGRTRSATVHHSIGSSVTASIQAIPYTGPDPILVIGAYQVRPSGALLDVNVRDTRVRGGGIHPEKYDDALKANTEAYSATDAGRWDGIPFPAAASGVLRLPRSMLDQYSEDWIQQQVERHLAVGGNILLEFTNEF